MNAHRVETTHCLDDDATSASLKVAQGGNLCMPVFGFWFFFHFPKGNVPRQIKDSIMRSFIEQIATWRVRKDAWPIERPFDAVAFSYIARTLQNELQRIVRLKGNIESKVGKFTLHDASVFFVKSINFDKCKSIHV